jgi:prefoldin subunit 5
MKKFITLIFSAVLLVSCTDYDSQFDQVDAKIKELAAANASLEAELAAMAALNASVSAQTAAKLNEFQGAVAAIVESLQALGTASAATIAQMNAIIEQISALAAQVASNSACASDLQSAIAEIARMLEILSENVYQVHHSGGGGHHSGGGTFTPFSAEATDNGDGALNLTVAVPCGTTMLRLSGPWWGWNPSGGPVGVDNGDGTFTFTLDPAPTENMEYLYTTDGVSYENLIDNAQNAECTDRVDGGRFNTDYYSYANRIWIVGSGDQAETFDSCSIDTID